MSGECRRGCCCFHLKEEEEEQDGEIQPVAVAETVGNQLVEGTSGGWGHQLGHAGGCDQPEAAGHVEASTADMVDEPHIGYRRNIKKNEARIMGWFRVVNPGALALQNEIKEVSTEELCQICGDGIELTEDGDAFLNCGRCAFPVCRTCYEYERREGTQACPHCETRYECHEGSPWVDGDNVDDLDCQPDFQRQRSQRDVQCTFPDGEGSDDLDLSKTEEATEPLFRKVRVASSKINPYRLIIILRLLVLAFFFYFRLLNPVANAYGLWLTSVVCEIWFALSWILDQFQKWSPVERETYLDRLSLRYEGDGRQSQLANVDIFVNMVDAMKEPPLVTVNTILSILSLDYPIEKVTCYVSDDGASMFTFEALIETSKFARKWVPFCKKFNIEPRAPEWYFSHKVYYFKDKIHPDFVRARREMKKEYEEFKGCISTLVSSSQKVLEDDKTMQDGSPWPGNHVRDHPGMIQVLCGPGGFQDAEGRYLPRLVYVSREKRPGFDHHKKAGAMNALVRVSAILSNAPFILTVDCDHYINNSKVLREAMCFLMDPRCGRRVCYVQFPQRFDGGDQHDRYANRDIVFFYVNMKGLDGIQGPLYVGTGCVLRRQALYGYDAPTKHKTPGKDGNCGSKWFSWCGTRQNNRKGMNMEMGESFKQRAPSSQIKTFDDGRTGLGGRKIENDPHFLKQHEERFGQSPLFVESTIKEKGGMVENSDNSLLLREAIHVIRCSYENKTKWGKEIGWIYGSVNEDILTGFKMHCHGWCSVYCIPKRPAFKGFASISLSDCLHQVLARSLGYVEIFLSKHCPIWYGYGGGLKCLERLSYINSVVYPWTSLPLIAYCTLPAVCLITGKFIIPEIDYYESIVLISLFLCIIATVLLEMQWSMVTLDDWWRNEQFLVIDGVSAQPVALFRGLLKVLAGVDTSFTYAASKLGRDDGVSTELYVFKWTSLLMLPLTLLFFNIMGVVGGLASALNNSYDSWVPLMGEFFLCFWVIIHLCPLFRGLTGKEDKIPSIIMFCSIILAAILSFFWVQVNPFVSKSNGPVLQLCGLDCDYSN